MHLYPIDGAAHRVGPTETPWAFRAARWGQVMVGVDPDNFFHVNQNIRPTT